MRFKARINEPYIGLQNITKDLTQNLFDIFYYIVDTCTDV